MGNVTLDAKHVMVPTLASAMHVALILISTKTTSAYAHLTG